MGSDWTSFRMAWNSGSDISGRVRESMANFDRNSGPNKPPMPPPPLFLALALLAIASSNAFLLPSFVGSNWYPAGICESYLTSLADTCPPESNTRNLRCSSKPLRNCPMTHPFWDRTNWEAIKLSHEDFGHKLALMPLWKRFFLLLQEFQGVWLMGYSNEAC